MIEGEGGFYAIKSKTGGYAFRLQFYNCNRELHERIAALTGARTYHVGTALKNGVSKKPQWMTYIESSKAVAVAEKLLPLFSKEKREKTLAAIEKWNTRNQTLGRPRKEKR